MKIIQKSFHTFYIVDKKKLCGGFNFFTHCERCDYIKITY